MRVSTWFCALTLVAAFSLPARAAAIDPRGEQDPAELVKVFDAAVRVWRQRIACRCEYVLKGAAVDSERRALELLANGIQDRESIVGLLVKRGDATRLSADYDKAGRLATLGRGCIAAGSFDTVCTKDLILSFHPTWGPNARLSIRREDPRASKTAFSAEALPLSPFNMLHDREDDPFSQRIRWRHHLAILRPDTEHLTLEFSPAADVTSFERFTFWTAVSPPALSRVEWGSTRPGKHGYSVRVDSFQNCGGVQFPTSLRSLTGPWRSVGMGQRVAPYWIIWDWRASALSDRPEKADFNVRIPGGVKLDGQCRGYSQGWTRNVNLLDGFPKFRRAGEDIGWRKFMMAGALCTLIGLVPASILYYLWHRPRGARGVRF